MQRIAFASFLTAFLASTPAVSGRLDLNLPTLSGLGSVFAAQAPAEPAPTPVRYAASGPNYGGGFIEMLFRGPGAAAPRQSEPEPQSPVYARSYDHGVSDPEARQVDPRFLKQEVNYDGREAPGTIVINTRDRYLYLVQGNGRAIRYGIGVGRPGFTWAGTHSVTNMREWPDWRPPAEMLRRQPHLPRYMRGGPDNPLGARALYLGSTLYRIHGSNEPWTIGTQVSSGCIRMRNEDVVDLYSRVRVGTRVVVI
jgi:lipoprotein-anchoring transpeptidase ErfK/SrfK